MKLAVALVLVLITFCTADGHVVPLGIGNFTEVLGNKEFALVEFYAPWCPHCKALDPEYTKLAEELKDQQNLQITKLDCDAEGNKEIAERLEVQGFPTLKLFKDGEVFREYDGERTAEDLKRWLLKQTGPLVQDVKVDQLGDLLKAAKKEETSVIIGYFASNTSDEYDQFVTGAESASLEEFKIVQVIGQKDETRNPNGKDSIVLVRHFEDGIVSSNEFSKLVEFIRDNAYPLIDTLSGKTFKRFVDSKLPIGILFLDPKQSDKNKELITSLSSVAKTFWNRVMIGHSDGKLYGDQLTVMGGNKKKLPGLGIMILNKRQNFPYNGSLDDPNQVQEWIEGVLNGTVPRFKRSQPVPVDDDEPVKVVVGNTFEEIVYNNETDVLVQFYAPWCHHSKKLAPKYEKLARKLTHVKNLIIAKIDASENDSPVAIEGFPTIMFFPSNKKDSPIVYDGYRTPKHITKWMIQHAVASKDFLKPKDPPKLEHLEKPQVPTHDEL
jgi:protein disulfide-isomerase A1